MVSRVSQTPLYDQLRDERLNADVPASDIDVSAAAAPQERLAPGGLRLVPGGGPVAVAVCGVCAGSEADLGVEPECVGRHLGHEEVPQLVGSARRARRAGAQSADGGSWWKATVSTEPVVMPSERGTPQGDPAVDTRAATDAPDAGHRRGWQQPPPAFVRSSVLGGTNEYQRGGEPRSNGATRLPASRRADSDDNK